MWTSTVGLINGKYRYLTAETFGFKVNSNGQMLKKRQQWTIEPFYERTSIEHEGNIGTGNDQYLVTHNGNCSSLNSMKSSSNGSSSPDSDPCNEEHENVAIKSHLNKYLAVDSFGNVTCDSDKKTDNARFTITICSMSQGRSKEEQIFWAFKNVERGYFLGATDDGQVCCNAKMPKSRAELWLLHLIPARGASFFALRSLARKRFARVAEENNTNTNSNQSIAQIQLDATNSWGCETLFQFKFHDGGLYSLLTSDCRYLTNEGHCITWKKSAANGPNDESSNFPPKECLFTIEYHGGFLAFRDSFSHYLAATGRTSVLRSRSAGVSRDELFAFESAPIQVSLKATFNNRWVSIKQGVDLSANQLDATSTTETFELTHHPDTMNWSIMTHECDYWTVSSHTNTISICKSENYVAIDKGQFRIVWSDSEATCSMKYVDSNNQEKWIAARKSGQLYVASSNVTPVKFIMRFQNRKLLNLRPVEGNGFVGLKSGSNSRQLEATKTSPDSIAIEYSELSSFNALSNESLISNDSLPIDNRNNAISKTNKFVISKDSDDDEVKLFEKSKLTSINMQSNRRQTDLYSYDDNHTSDSGAGSVLNGDVKELEDFIDANNNCCEVKNKMLEDNDVSVDPSPIPSVASIISSFSNAAINSKNKNSIQTSSISSNRVSKLASSFNVGNHTINTAHNSDQDSVDHHSQSPGDATSDSASVISNCQNSKLSRNNSQDHEQSSSGSKLSTSERLAQFECCYLKILNNNRYLVVGDKDSSIVCDAVNRACAQPWIIELRSHNTIAIRASDDHAYMQLGTNGTISLSRCEPEEASLWEF